MVNQTDVKGSTIRKSYKRFYALPLTFMLFAILLTTAGSATIITKAQSLPSCTDPTGQNLQCMIVISTLPHANALQCQETSGEILSCSYATQVLSNGQQAVVITVYVPPNFVFSSPTQIKVVVHTKTVTGGGGGPPGHSFAYIVGQKWGTDDGRVGVYDVAAACAAFTGNNWNHCRDGYLNQWCRKK